MEKSRRRKPFQERWINELSDQDLQQRVKVIGSILDIKSDPDQDQIQAILDDGSGHVRVVINHPISYKTGNQIRVFGILSKTERDEYIIDAEIIQDMTKLDIDLYKRVQNVKRQFKEKYSI